MATSALLTSEQFLALPDEFDQSGNPIRQELIAGEVVSMPPPSQLHDVIRSNITEQLILFLASRASLGLKVLPGAGFVLSKHETVVPDVCVIREARLQPRNQKYISGGPEIAIEVVSPYDTASHLKAKVDAYLASGSLSVWVVFPDARSVMIHTPNAVRELRAGQLVEDSALPDFSVFASAFFELT